jgi:glycosyltransferase involved in cell wall biosynthesis
MLAQEIGSDPQLMARPLAPARTSAATLQMLFAGRLIGWKGVHLALSCLRQLHACGVAAELRIAGAGRLRSWLEQRARTYGLGDQVKFLGAWPRERMHELYEAADVFLFPSLHDSSGNVVLEALSSGLPVVCLDLGGPQYFVDETCGRVVSTQCRDEQQLGISLAEAVCELTRDRERYEAARQAAWSRARELTWGHQVKRCYLMVLQELRIQGATPMDVA